MQLGSCWSSARILCPPKQIIFLQSRISSSRVEFERALPLMSISVLKAARGRYLLWRCGGSGAHAGAAVCSIGELRLGVCVVIALLMGREMGMLTDALMLTKILLSKRKNLQIKGK